MNLVNGSKTTAFGHDCEYDALEDCWQFDGVFVARVGVDSFEYSVLNGNEWVVADDCLNAAEVRNLLDKLN